jgi:putative nucleotidyltransferase with HDIG domain
MTLTAEAETAWKSALAKVRSFPTLPAIVNKVTELTGQPDTSAKDIEGVIGKDQALTAKLLRLVNSPFYGFPHRITTISRAVGIIGFEALRNLVFSTSVIHLFKSDESPTFRPVDFWKHSLGTALAAKGLAWRLGERQVEEYFVGGLIHDIGKLVHHEYFAEPFHQAGRMALEQGRLLRDAEEEVLRFTHDQTGGFLLAQWNLPPNLIAMAAHHHAPGEARQYQREAGVVHLADILCRAKGLGNGGDHSIPCLDRATWDRLGLTVGDIEIVMRRMGQDFDDMASFLIE